MDCETQDLLAQGKRDLVCGEVLKAVENLQKVCSSLASKHDEFDDCLGTPYLLYGSALLELVRMESGVIGNALDGIPEQGDSVSSSDDELVEDGPELTADEKEDLSNQVIDAMCSERVDVKSGEKEEEADSVNEASSELEDGNELADEDECVDNDDKQEEDGEEIADEDKCGNDDKKQEEDGDVAQESDSEDITNLQIAWEVIEVARKIFSKKDDDESKLNVAECLEKIGELSREQEDYVQAIKDLQESLSIRLAVLGSNDRMVAETYYQIGTTYAISGQLDEALNAFRSSVECLKQHADGIKDKLKVITDQSDVNKLTLENTLKEIEELIPDIMRRIGDIEEDRLSERVKPSSSQTVVSRNGFDQPAGDISHLIRKKRSVEKESEASILINNGTSNGESSPNSKKPKISTETNGSH